MITLKNNQLQLLFNFITVFITCYTVFEITSQRIALSDDLSALYQSKTINQNYFDFILRFLDTSTMSARPLSGLITGTLIFFSKYNEIIYYIGLIAFPISLYLIYSTLKNIISLQFAGLFTFLYATSIFASSIQFSPIMINSNLATIFYVLSVRYILVKRNLFLSSLFFIASILSYEIFLPALIINVFLIKPNRQKVLYGLFTIVMVFSYRLVLQDLIFDNSYHRDTLSNILNFPRDLKIMIFAFKMFIRDFFLAHFEALKKFPLLDRYEMILSFVIPFIFYQTFKKNKIEINYLKVKRLAYISSAALIVSFSIFFISDYIPTMFGFENRNLGAVRLFFNLTLLSFTVLLTRGLTANRLSLLLTVMIFINTLSLFTVKNAWIYADKFNNQIFKKVKINIENNNIREGVICIDYDIYNERRLNPNFLLREPTFYNPWEAAELCIRNGIDPEKYNIFYTDRHKKNCQYYFTIKLEH